MNETWRRLRSVDNVASIDIHHLSALCTFLEKLDSQTSPRRLSEKKILRTSVCHIFWAIPQVVHSRFALLEAWVTSRICNVRYLHANLKF